MLQTNHSVNEKGHFGVAGFDCVELAGKYGVSQAQICLRFALDCGVVPLPKSADAGRMRQNLALDFALEAEDLERLRTMPQTGWSGLHPDK